MEGCHAFRTFHSPASLIHVPQAVRPDEQKDLFTSRSSRHDQEQAASLKFSPLQTWEIGKSFAIKMVSVEIAPYPEMTWQFLCGEPSQRSLDHWHSLPWAFCRRTNGKTCDQFARLPTVQCHCNACTQNLAHLFSSKVFQAIQLKGLKRIYEHPLGHSTSLAPNCLFGSNASEPLQAQSEPLKPT